MSRSPTRNRRPQRRRRGASGRRPAGARGRAPRSAAAGARERRRRAEQAARRAQRRALLVLAVVLLLLVGMASGPLADHEAATQRVAELTAQRDALAEAVDELEVRRSEVADPEVLELLARDEQGLVAPGELPFVTVTPPTETFSPTPDGGAPIPTPGPRWYQRLWSWVRAVAG